ncbi:DUF6988 family protein [Burkholderia cepacia]|uniref:DUF6988 family protein n=1 Tax=Burkholderia cepacia TaxID=292 RepID=UPI0035D8C33B
MVVLFLFRAAATGSLSGLTLPADERSQLAIGCLDVTLEHQAAIALLHSSELYGSMMALLRVLSESLVRGLWLHACATDVELTKFKRGRLEKSFGALIKEYEDTTETSEGVLSGFKLSAWAQMNDFTHTGLLQVSRRHKPGRVEGNYPDHDLRTALGVAGALGLVAAEQLIALAERARSLAAVSGEDVRIRRIKGNWSKIRRPRVAVSHAGGEVACAPTLAALDTSSVWPSDMGLDHTQHMFGPSRPSQVA